MWITNFALLILGSIGAGWALAGLTRNVVLWRRPLLGTRWWRLWAVLAGWIWVPVPAAMSWVYQ